VRTVSAAQHLRVCFTKLWMGEGICFKAREAVDCALLDRMMGSVSQPLMPRSNNRIFWAGPENWPGVKVSTCCCGISQALSKGQILKMPTRQKIEYVIFDMDGMIQLL
jgi:hypothetical protein